MKISLLLAAAVAALSATAASATTFSGTFTQDDGKAGFAFYVAAPTVLTITSTGYAAGGLDPVLSLYDAAGNAVDFNDDNGVNPDSQLIETTLTTGRYRVFLTQYDNFGPASLALPFNFEGQHNFRGGFIDYYGNQRTGFWSLDITGGFAATAVPEAATWGMMIAGFGLVGAAARRRRTVVSVAA